ncbi:hypothetical protein F5X68DRAFT_222296 [Plectosphaerella plurivora]|uniref:Uncharacterized protein n=1 Tax=Plectosphaerella plurivora TaxID=936078 RepID=A0A9P8VCA3_9PEZI|nr:hypothetical protein F5X68DRAFT_222296 [Plectosphaerella plurivora]
MAQPELVYGSTMSNGAWNPSRSSAYNDGFPSTAGYDGGFYRTSSIPPYSPGSSTYNLPMGAGGHGSTSAYIPRPPSGAPGTSGAPAYGSYKTSAPQPWDYQGRYSPTDSVDDIIASPNLSDYSLDNNAPGTTPPGKSKSHSKGSRPQRRPSNRDEFDGPHQFLARPPPEYVALQERELPHLPTNLLVQEQDTVLSQVNDRLSLCAFDFVAKYQFPIPLTQDMRPVERPQDREWTEWVYLLKRLATKRRIPARVLYNGQIKQFVTILENSLEMRHAAKHQSRPLKDDRNILQLISAGIQVAKILKDASAMKYLDQLYVQTEQQIQERAAASRFRG